MPLMGSGAYQQPAWCWHLVWRSQMKKLNHFMICRSQSEREFIMIVLFTWLGWCSIVMTQGFAHVTPWPLSLPLGDLSMVLGNYRCDARRESQGELPEFKAEFHYRALFQKMVTEFCICLLVYVVFMFHPAFIVHFKSVATQWWAAGFFDSFQWAKVDAQLASKLQIQTLHQWSSTIIHDSHQWLSAHNRILLRRSKDQHCFAIARKPTAFGHFGSSSEHAWEIPVIWALHFNAMWPENDGCGRVDKAKT